MRHAVRLAQAGVDGNSGGPFGAVVVKDGRVIGEGWNRVTSTNDPTAHAEVVAIRGACETLKTFQLEGCEIYTTCEPCPMCLGAIYWARPAAVYIGCNREDAAAIGFDDQMIYEELDKPLDSRRIKMKTLLREEALEVFRSWEAKEDKIRY